MNKNYLEYIANVPELTTFHYKILLLLLTKEYTQAELSRFLNVKRQNINTHVKTLEDLGLISVGRTEGRNKFYYAITDIKQIEKREKTVL